MRKLMMASALGCLAMATAADAQLVRAAPGPCAYGNADRDLVIEIALLDLPGWSDLALA